jgi:hypothetical protein
MFPFGEVELVASNVIIWFTTGDPGVIVKFAMGNGSKIEMLPADKILLSSSMSFGTGPVLAVRL